MPIKVGDEYITMIPLFCPKVGHDKKGEIYIVHLMDQTLSTSI